MSCLILMMLMAACGGGSDDASAEGPVAAYAAAGPLQPDPGAGAAIPLSLAAADTGRGANSAGAASGAASSAEPRSYPPEQIVSSRAAAAGIGPKPAYRVRRDLPGYGTSLMRITDAGSFGLARRINRHAYAKQQPWNSDGSRLMLHFQWPALLVDGKGFGFIKAFEPPEDPLWSNTDPDLIYGVLSEQAAFVRYRVSTGVQTIVRRFGGYTSIHIGGGEGNLSHDGRLLALIGKRAGGVDVVVYDVLSDLVISTGRFDGLSGPHGDINSATVSPSGRYVLLGVEKGGSDRGWDLYDASSMRFLRRLVHDQFSHADIGYNTAGEEVLLTAANGKSAMVSIRLVDGIQRQELSSAHMTWFNHVSCRNNLRPGWCYVSSYDEGTTQLMIRELFALKLDGSGTVQRFAPAIFADTPDDDEDYTRSPMAVPNRDGSLVLFASDWADPSLKAAVDTYVTGIRLP
jgi:hypothetical protein